MAELPKKKLLLATGLALILVFAGSAVVLSKFGGDYRKSLFTIMNQAKPQEYTLGKKKTVRKITIRKNNQEGCLEITPDGAVRIYDTCGTDIEAAFRLTDTKNILKLFTLVSETNLGAYRNVSTGDMYVITVETDEGTETYYLVKDDKTPLPIQDITDTIDDIEEDIPAATPTPTQETETPVPTGTVLSPTIRVPTGSTTPTPTGSPSQSFVPFSCDFTESSGDKRPFNVSNIICSSEPTPYPQ